MSWHIPGGWHTYQVETPGGAVQTHLVPHGDLGQHRLAQDCTCCPVEDDEVPDYWSHNAWDQRESYEQGRKLH